MMKPLLNPISLALTLGFCSAANAQVNSSLPVVVISAQPLIEELRVDEFAMSSAVIGEAQLRDLNAVDLAAALRRTPGVQISRYNPVGSFGGDQGGAVFIRGMGVSRPGSEIKSYIDGLPFYMGVWNHPLLDLLPVNAMRNITVNKSPQLHNNGNNFASINLETRRARQEGLQGNLKVAFGSYSTLIEQADLTGQYADWDFVLAQGHAKSNGHRLNAEGELTNLLAKLNYRLDTNWRLSLSALALDNKAKDPGDTRLSAAKLAPQYNTRGNLLSVSVQHQHGNWQGEFKLYQGRGHGDWLQQAGLDGDTLSNFKSSGVHWQERYQSNTGFTFIAGYDYDKVSGDVQFNRVAPAPRASFDAPEFNISSAYLSAAQQIGLSEGWKLTPSVGLRHYQHNQLASETAAQLGLILSQDTFSAFANWSQGVNYPGQEVAVLSALIPPMAQSWKKLQAERLDHLEAGIKYQPNQTWQIDAMVFRDKLKNRYIFGFPPDVPPPPQFLNFGGYTTQGWELAARYRYSTETTVVASFTGLAPGLDNLPYSPKQAISAGVNTRLAGFNLALDAVYQSEVRALNRARAAGAVNNEKLAGFTVLNGRLAYPLQWQAKSAEIYLALDNLLNRDYAYRPGYPMPGRSAQLGVTLGF